MAGILKRLESRKTHLTILGEWLETRPKKEREEWLEALRRADLYSSSAIFDLLREHGCDCINENAVIRYRRQLDGYVSKR